MPRGEGGPSAEEDNGDALHLQKGMSSQIEFQLHFEYIVCVAFAYLVLLAYAVQAGFP